MSYSNTILFYFKNKNDVSIEVWVAPEANIVEKHLERDLSIEKHQLSGLLE